MKKIITTIILIGIATVSRAATFNSNGAATGWSNAASWTVVSGTDADNIPDFDDDIVILTGHTIILSGTSNAKSVTVDAGGIFDGAFKYLSLKGNFTNSGTLLNKFLFLFSSATCTITSSSQVNITYLSVIGTTVNLAAGTQIVGTGVTVLIRNGGIFNNNGSVSIGNLSTYGTSPTGTWNNLAGSSLTYGNNQDLTVMPNLVSAATSTITLNKPVTSIFPHTFANLTLAGNPSTKTCSSTLNVSGNLTINTGVTLNLANNTLALGGNLSNSGTISNLATVNFNGTSTQTINTPGSLSITNLNSASTSTVSLATGTYNVTTSTALNGALTIAAPVTLNLNSNTLNLGGSLTNSGTISNLVDANFSGTAAQDISSSSSLTFDDLNTSNAGVKTISAGTYSVTNSIKVVGGNLNVGSDLVTLVSTTTKTAFIDIAASTGSIAGTLIMQRNIDAQAAAWHELSSPSSSATFSDWDDELYMSIGEADDGSGDYTGGDGTAGGDHSVFFYNEPTLSWDSITTGGGVSITKGVGYYTFIADDPSNFPGRAIDIRNTPTMGNTTIGVTHDASDGGTYEGWNLIGNPYAAHLDWDVVRTANPALLETTNIQTLQGGTYADLVGEIVPPGQGFWVYAQATGTLTVPSAAATTSTGSNFDRVIPIKNYDLKLRLSSNNNPYYHEIKIAYNDGTTNGFDKGKDLIFLKSPHMKAPSMTFVDGNKKFIRNNIDTKSNISTHPLEINAPVDGNYVIDIIGIIGNSEYDKAFILNKNTGEMIELSDANPVTLYLESKSTYTNYSLVLSKSGNINDPSLAEDNISIFSTSEFINVKGNSIKSTSVKIEVINLLGQTLIQTNGEIVANNAITIPVESLTSDIYVVKVTTAEGRQISKKVVVAK